jgi:uncharacterized repeat protein (TIGR03803 family)
MTPSKQSRLENRAIDLWTKIAVVAMAVLLIGLASHGAQAQTFSVLHSFDGGNGLYPAAGLTIDRGGNFYGTARDGGSFTNGYFCELFFENGCGTVFRFSKHGSSWILLPLWEFNSTNGAYPTTPITIGPNGSLYGATSLGGPYGGFGNGVIFHLAPTILAPASLISFWSESLVYSFTGNDDGGPGPSALIFDGAGNLYGATVGGTYGAGTIFEFTPSGGGWMENVLYSFPGSGANGEYPQGIVADSTFDHLYGATFKGGTNGCDGSGCGVVFELTRSGSDWTESVLHTFTDGYDGAWPLAPPIIDAAGNIYGTSSGGFVSPGTVWELSPSGGGWTFTVLYTFTGLSNRGPYGGLTMDAAGNLYGTTNADGPYGEGNVFKLSSSNGGWTYTDLYDFTGGNDGGAPEGNVTLDANGNIYGTTTGGGQYGFSGVIWEITP